MASSSSSSSQTMGTPTNFQLLQTYYTFVTWEPEQQQPHQQKHKKARKDHQQEVSKSVQFCFEFSLECKCNYLFQKLNGQRVFLEPEQFPAVIKTFTIDPSFFKCRNQLYDSIAYMLSEVGFDKDIQGAPIEKIASAACKVANSVSNTERSMLKLRVDIVANAVYFRNQREEVLARLLRESMDENESRESMVENESRGYGMVPACKTAVNNLKKLKFKGGDSMNSKCTICFDEFEVGSEVTSLPCKHVFHGECIGSWLGTSHLCPICRFKMPVEVR
ncbi:hypothetical protein IFM89_036092 [Coptis chinensis]|uniref:RING-type domain-containing protein n=1 Tax=Coptis chinensis TaxID=261450 RepID=A0A835J1J6_9MAGN|nr:hypothetical protein IFM89_036092 [Coptis chinensis]